MAALAAMVVFGIVVALIIGVVVTVVVRERMIPLQIIVGIILDCFAWE